MVDAEENQPASRREKTGFFKSPFFRSPAVWPLAGIIFLIAVNMIMDPAFLRITVFEGHLFGVPIDILNQGSRIMILALGMTLVISTGGIDLSVGSVVAISGSVAALMISQGAESLPYILMCSVAAGAIVGLANGVLVAFAGVQPIVATLIFMVAGRGIAQLITDGEVIIISHAGFGFLGNGYFLALPVAALIAGLLYFATHFSLSRTAGRLYIESVGDNPTASRFVGIPAARVKCLVYVFSGVCAGVAGVLAASNIRAADAYRAGENMELDAIFAVVVGGTALTGGRFLLLGSLFGALLLQTLTITMYNIGVPPAVATVPKALLILFVCVLQSDRIGRWIKSMTRRGGTA